METNPVLAYGAWLAETPDAWPDEVLEAAHRQFIDLLGVTIAGAVEPATLAVLETVRNWGAGPATAILQSARLAPPWAALVNGTASHALDFDDNFDPAKAHATAVLAPAISFGGSRGPSGAMPRCFTPPAYPRPDSAIVVNPPTATGLARPATVGRSRRRRLARLLSLDAETAANAISISTSMAAGFMSQFGTMTKPLHAGLAAKSGVMAASLARAGIDAGLDTLDGPTGMNRLMVGPDYEQLRDSLTHVEHGQTLRFETERIGDPLLILSSGFRVKRFPICGSAHRAMDGVLSLKQSYEITPDQVVAIDIYAPVSHLNNLMYTDPQDALQAKFSLEYGVACALVTGNCGLADFTDEAAKRPEIRAFYPRIHRHPVDKAEGEFPTEVHIKLTDGRTVSERIAMPAGSLAAPFTLDQVWAKFDGCAAPFLPPERLAAAHDTLADLPHLPSIAPLMAALYDRPR